VLRLTRRAEGLAGLRARIERRVSRVAARTCLAPLSALLAIGLLSGELWGIPPRFAHFAVLVAVVLATGALLFGCQRIPGREAMAIALAAAAVVGLAILPDPPTRILLLLVWATGASVLAERHPESARGMGGALLAGGALVLLRVVPGVGLLADQISRSLSGAVGTAWGGARLGASASGLTAWLALSAFLVAVPLSGRRRARAFAVISGLALVHAIVQGTLAASLARNLTKDAFFVLGAITVAHAALAGRSPGRLRRSRTLAAAAGLVASALLFAIAILPTLWTDMSGSRRILVYDHAILGSWETPADRPPGAAFTGAMFGLLPEYLQAFGHACDVRDVVDAHSLREPDLVVLINPGRPFSTDERENLLRFVHGGGALLVFADHTDIGGMKGYLDDLLAPVGLMLAFDSAVSVSRDWRRALHVSFPFSTAYGDLDVPVSIGASVEAVPAAANVPLLVGTDAFADPGDRGNTDGAMLGNLRYDAGEAYGGVLLAVATPFGAGKVALFGDTSPFQNVPLATSYAYTDALVRWLTDGAPPWREPVGIVLCVLLVGVAWLAVRLSPNAAIRCALAASLCVALVVGTWAASRPIAPRLPTEGRLAVIERSRTNRLSCRALDPEGIDALTVGLSRSGYLPIVVSEGETAARLKPDDLLISVGATAAIDPAGAGRLLDAVDRGVDLIVGTEWPSAGAADALLGELGVRVEKTPLGSARPVVAGLESNPQLGSAWPLALSDAWTPLAATELGGERFSVAARRSVGAGTIVVVGDVGIFANAALEGKGNYFPENVAFLDRLLEEMRTP